MAPTTMPVAVSDFYYIIEVKVTELSSAAAVVTIVVELHSDLIRHRPLYSAIICQGRKTHFLYRLDRRRYECCTGSEQVEFVIMIFNLPIY